MITSDDLKQTRLALGEDQETFASHFGVNQSTVHRWETLGIPTRGTSAIAVERVMVDLRARALEQAMEG